MSLDWSLCHTETMVVLLGRGIAVHSQALGPFRLASVLAGKTKYGQRVIGQAEQGMMTPQGYNCRNIDGTIPATPAKHSEHAHNIATDISPWENPMSNTGIYHCAMAMFGIDDGAAFIGAFHTAGFRWGGVWDDAPTLASQTDAVIRKRLAVKPGTDVSTGRIDPMHFELELSTGQVSGIDWDQLIADAQKEDPLADLTQAQIDALATLTPAQIKQIPILLSRLMGEREGVEFTGVLRGLAEGNISGKTKTPLPAQWSGQYAQTAEDVYVEHNP